MKKLEVTPLEKQVLTALAEGMYAELGFSDMGIEEIATATGLSRKVIRGVAGSLEKKRYIDIDDRGGEYKNDTNMHIWNLTELTHGLVPHWVGEKCWLTKIEVEPVTLVEKIHN
jgi:hypothetical protein